jgi:hypothetical protein
MPLNLEDSQKVRYPDNPQIKRIDPNTGAILSAIPSPGLRSDDIIVESAVKEELQKLRQDFDQYRADEAAKNAADEERHRQERKSDRMFSIFAGAISGLLVAIVAGLFLYYWPFILAFFNH